jgi:hypothetical protein
MVGTVSRLTFFAVDKWVIKIFYVSTSLPNSWVHEDRSIDALNIFTISSHGIPPSILNGALNLNA